MNSRVFHSSLCLCVSSGTMDQRAASFKTTVSELCPFLFPWKQAPDQGAALSQDQLGLICRVGSEWVQSTAIFFVLFSVLLCFCSLSCSVFLFSVLLYVLCPVFLFSVLLCVLCPMFLFSVLLCVFVLSPGLCSLSSSVFLFSVLLCVFSLSCSVFSLLLCVFVLCPALCFVLCPAVCFVLCSVPPPTPYLVFSCTLFFVVLSALPCHAGHPKEIRAMRTNKSFFPFLIWNNDLMLGKRYFTPKVQAVCPVERCSFSTSCVLTFQSRCWHSLLLWYV